MKRQRGTGGLFKQPTSNVWWLGYYRSGRFVRESSRTKDEAKAKRMLKQRIAQVTTGTHPGLEVERVRVEELAEDFLRDYKINGHKSLDDVEARWRLHLSPFFQGMRAIHVSSQNLSQYIDERQQQGASNATVNRELAALKRMFRLGYNATPPKVVRVPHFPFLKENNARKGFLEDAQFDKLVADAALWFRALVECGASIGWRHEELLGLRVRQIDLEHRVVRLEPGETKNGEGREAPMTDNMHQLLAACVEGKAPDDAVFTWDNSKPVLSIRDTWARACCIAGLGAMHCKKCDSVLAKEKLPQCPTCQRKLTRDEQSYRGLLFHDLRRTAARNLRRSGMPESLIMDIGGWKTASVFRRYAITDRRTKADAMRQYERYQQELAKTRAENAHTSLIPDPLDPQIDPPSKLQ